MAPFDPPARAEGRSARRTLAVLAALVVALGVGVGIALPLRAEDPDGVGALNAYPIDPPRTAPETAGRGADGAEILVPREGRPAVVTFLFTECPDVCPLIANQLAAALDELGGEAAGIDVVAISVDPEGDTPKAARRFLARHGLAGRLDYLVGSRESLEPIWAAWQIGAQPAGGDGEGGHEGGHVRSVHSAPVLLVDRTGRQVGKYSPGIPFSPDDLAADMRELL
jgi:protein SCO1/2